VDFLLKPSATNRTTELWIVIVVCQHLLRGKALATFSALKVFSSFVYRYFMIPKMRSQFKTSLAIIAFELVTLHIK
jgi:hypothetical protein